MRNIVLFILKNHVIFVFFILETVAISLTLSNNSFHSAKLFSASNTVVGGIYNVNSRINEYLQLRKVNQLLAEENSQLRELLWQSQYASTDSFITVVDTVYKEQYTYIPARIVHSTVNRQSNYITIDKGTIQGVRTEMAIISSNGIVGIVKQTSPNYSVVLPLLHRKSSISARLKGAGYFGALRWDGRDPLIMQLHDIPNHVELKEGMEVETSGFSAMFPEGLIIGKVVSFKQEAGENFHSIEVKLSTDPRTLHMVYVVNNRMRLEQIQLEEQTIEADE